jgi:ketosteroid isomerase-like protein
MGQENVELVVRAYVAFAGGAEAVIEFCDEDVEFVNPHDAIEPGTRKGHDGVRAWFASFTESWYDTSGRMIRIVDLGDTVVTEVETLMKGKGGIELTTRFGHIWTLRDGRVVRWEWFREPDQAFRAAGLPEQSR